MDFLIGSSLFITPLERRLLWIIQRNLVKQKFGKDYTSFFSRHRNDNRTRWYTRMWGLESERSKTSRRLCVLQESGFSRGRGDSVAACIWIQTSAIIYVNMLTVNHENPRSLRTAYECKQVARYEYACTILVAVGDKNK